MIRPNNLMARPFLSKNQPYSCIINQLMVPVLSKSSKFMRIRLNILWMVLDYSCIPVSKFWLRAIRKEDSRACRMQMLSMSLIRVFIQLQGMVWRWLEALRQVPLLCRGLRRRWRVRASWFSSRCMVRLVAAISQVLVLRLETTCTISTLLSEIWQLRKMIRRWIKRSTEIWISCQRTSRRNLSNRRMSKWWKPKELIRHRAHMHRIFDLDSHLYLSFSRISRLQTSWPRYQRMITRTVTQITPCSRLHITSNSEAWARSSR